MGKKYTVDIMAVFDTPQQVNMFINMLAWMEMCGDIGHRTKFVVDLDGDGGARPFFAFDTVLSQEQYNKLKQEICDEYNNTYKPEEKPVLIDASFTFE